MDNKVKLANDYVTQAIALYEQCGEAPDVADIINDAANFFGDTFVEYQKIYDILLSKYL